jgi:hypothetical protein
LLLFSIRVVYRISGRAAHAPKWDGESGYRLHVSPLSPRTSRRDIEKIFSKYGSINEVSSSLDILRFVASCALLGMDGHKSTLFCLCKFQTSRRCRGCHARNGWKVRSFFLVWQIIVALSRRSIDNTRIGISFARKRTIGGRRGGSFNGGGRGGDRYGGSRDDYDSSRNRRRYSPRQDDRYVESLHSRCQKNDLFCHLPEVTIVDVDTHVHVVLFKTTNETTVQDQDLHRPSRVLCKFVELIEKCLFRRSRRNRPSSRDRSPQQQASNAVNR